MLANLDKLDILVPPIDPATKLPLWTLDELISGSVTFSVTTSAYSSVIADLNPKKNSVVPIAIDTKKIDFSQNVLLTDKIMFVPSDTSLFEVHLKSDSSHVTPTTPPWTSVWAPFDKKWELTTKTNELPVYFKYVGQIPSFISLEEYRADF